MTITYTSLLGLTKPDTGTQSGTWGSDVNTGLTDYLDAAVAGAQVISGSQTAVTLSVTVGTSGTPTTLSQAGSGSTGSSQYQIIRCTGNPASTLVIDAPKQDKTYVVINATSTNQTVTLRGGPSTPTTGVNIVAGEKAVCAWNGSDFVKVSGTAGGSNTQVQYNSSGVLAGSSNMTFDGTSLSLKASPNLIFESGGNERGRIVTGTGAFELMAGSTVTPTISLASSVATFTNNPVLSGGTANGVLYLNGSKVATSGSALTFDGTTLENTGKLLLRTSSAPTVAGQYGYDASVGTYIWSKLGSGSNFTLYNNAGYNAYTIDASDNHIWARGTGSEQMRLTSTGLGIGTSSPDVKLVVKAGNGNQLVLDNAGETYTQMGFKTGGTARGTIWATATDFSLYTYSTQPIIFWTNATERMRLDSSGNLGIGTSSPAAKLNTSIEVSSGTTKIHYLLSEFGTTADSGMQIKATNSTYSWDAGAITFKRESTANSYGLQFDTSSGGTNSTRMTLNSSGNLGLGVTPSAWYVASANARTLQINNAGFYADTGNSVFISSNYLFNTSGSELFIGNGYANRFLINSGEFRWFTSTTNNSSGANQPATMTQAMTLDASGNLGIGETNPGQRLVVRNTSAAPYISIIAGDSSLMGILLGKASNTVDGQILYSNSTQAMQFVTASAERARITSGGDFRVKGAGAAGSTEAFQVSGSAPANAARITSGGDLLVGTTTATSALTVEKGVNNATNGLSLVNNNGSDGDGSAVSFYGAFGAPFTPTQLLARINGFVTDPNGAKNGNIAFFTGSSGTVTERARITSGGDLQIANGNLVMSTSGKGIDFSATSSGSGTMTSELLSDYEEGTWTPVMDSNTAGSGRVSTGDASYTKIGRMVHAYCDVTLSTLGTGGSGRWVIKGFPFTMAGTWPGTVGFFADLNANVGYISCFTNGGATQVFMTLTTGAAATIVDAPDFSTYVKQNSRVFLSVSYSV